MFIELHEPSSIVASTISGNTASLGGGVCLNQGASVTLERCIVSGNCADDDGGDVFVGNSDDLSSIAFECCALDSSGVAIGSQENHLEYVGQQVWDTPLFCEPVSCESSPIAGGEYGLRPGSPCAPESSPCGMRIGALEVGCGPASVPDLTAARSGIEVFPNPMSGDCVFQLSGLFAQADDGKQVERTFTVSDAAGRRVKRMTAFGGSCTWDGKDELRVPVASGVYFVSAGAGTPGTRITLVR